MNDLAILVSARPVVVLALHVGLVTSVKVFGHFFQVVARRVSRDALVLGRAGLGSVFAALLVAVVAAVGAAYAGPGPPDEPAADVARSRGSVVVFLEPVGGGKGDFGVVHHMT